MPEHQLSIIFLVDGCGTLIMPIGFMIVCHYRSCTFNFDLIVVL